jgi:hypothetical protein
MSVKSSYVDQIFRQVSEMYRAALEQGDAHGSSSRALRRLIQRVEAFEREMSLSNALPMHRIAELREAIAEAKGGLK